MMPKRIPETGTDSGFAGENSNGGHAPEAALSAEPSGQAKASTGIDIRTGRNRRFPPKIEVVDSELRVKGDEASFATAMQQAFGTLDFDLIAHLLRQATSVLPDRAREDVKGENFVLAALSGIEPRDELEGLLAVQMVAVHNLAMAFLSHASLEGQTTPGIDLNVNRATKLMRTFAALTEALHRHRSKGEQKMIVEHVHVHSGGQAIVGPVNKSCPPEGKK
jgi:hypothetical protein